jgi:hypothetical protein
MSSASQQEKPRRKKWRDGDEEGFAGGGTMSSKRPSRWGELEDWEIDECADEMTEENAMTDLDQLIAKMDEWNAMCAGLPEHEMAALQPAVAEVNAAMERAEVTKDLSEFIVALNEFGHQFAKVVLLRPLAGGNA